MTHVGGLLQQHHRLPIILQVYPQRMRCFKRSERENCFEVIGEKSP